MLILSRRVGESVLIGDEIKITIVEIDRGKIRLGFTAPKEVVIHREEVYQEIRRLASMQQPSLPSPETGS